MRSLSCFVLLSFVSSALGAGFASHNIAARRATEFEYFAPTSDPKSFYGLATARTDALQAGAPYPDYLYTCGDEHDAGEEAHWVIIICSFFVAVDFDLDLFVSPPSKWLLRTISDPSTLIGPMKDETAMELVLSHLCLG